MPSISRTAAALLIGTAVLAASDLPVSWTATGGVKSFRAEVGAAFGSVVAVSGDTLVVGAPGEDGAPAVEGEPALSNAGAAYVYKRMPSGWILQARLVAFNAGAGDAFGQSVAIDGETIIVGAPGEDSAASGVDAGNGNDNDLANAGAAYVYTREDGAWSRWTYLKSPMVNSGDGFGESVAVSGDRVVVGAPMANREYGGAYVFTRQDGLWRQGEALSTTGYGDQFGFSVAIDGTTVVVGSPWHNRGNYTGCAGVFVLAEDGTWDREGLLESPTADRWDLMGTAVGISGDTAVVAAPGVPPVSGTMYNGSMGKAGGAAFVFTRSAGEWSFQAKLTASNAEGNDQFGYGEAASHQGSNSVAIDGDTIVVGAPWEDSAATGIDGNGADNTASSSGAVYLFTRGGSTWTQKSYFKASNTGTGDLFGRSVSITPGAIVVGAPGEDSSWIGVPADNSVADSGTAYVYRLLLPPDAPHDPAQVDAAGGAIPAGGSAHLGFDIRAGVTDPTGARVRIQVEVKPAGFPFNGAGILESVAAKSGTTASVKLRNLPPGDYHWRIRTSTGDFESPWTGFGGNAEPDGADISLVNGAPSAVSFRQRRAGSGTDLMPGQPLYETERVTFEVTAVDPDGDDVLAEIEVRRTGELFVGAATHSGSWRGSGSTTSFDFEPGLGGYAWKLRTVDALGSASAWVSFGGNPENEPDFLVGPLGSRNGGCGAAAPGGSALPAALLAALLLLLSRSSSRT